jgi:hypothetical protein
MDAGLLALAQSDTESESESAHNEVVASPPSPPTASASSANAMDAALDSLQGRRYTNKQSLEKARDARIKRLDTSHLGYVTEMANKRSTRKVEIVQSKDSRHKTEIRKPGGHKRWHEDGLLHVIYRPFGDKEELTVLSTSKRARRRRMMREAASSLPHGNKSKIR